MKLAIKSCSTLAVASTFLSLLSGVAFAQQASSLDSFSNAPTVTVGGFVNTIAAVRGEESYYSDDRLPDAQLNPTNGQVVAGSPGTHNRMSNELDFANDSEIHIKVGGINEYGMKYGAVVELEADVSRTDGRKEGFNADKSYLFTESRLGKFEMGNNIGANQKMRVGPSVFARAAGGINGRYLEYINLPMLADETQKGVTKIGNCEGFRVDAAGNVVTPSGSDCAKVKLPRFILIPQSPIAHGGYAKGFYNRATDNDYAGTSADDSTSFNRNRSDNALRDGSFGELEDANKISYYTPRIAGWQLGASFTPDTGNSGSSAVISGDNSGDVKNVVSFGLNYSNNFGNLGLALSGTGEVGKFEQPISTTGTNQRNDLSSYDLGVMVTYFGFTLGGTYGSWGDSLQPKSGIYSCDYDGTVAISDQDCVSDSTYASGVKKFNDATYWTAGLAYQFGPVAISATHIQSDFQNNQYQATSIGLDYRMAKGFMPYIEVTQFQFESNQAKGTNVNQSNLSGSARQIRDNEGYVALTGVLFAF